MPRKKKESKRGIVTVYLPVSLIDQVKNVVYWTPGLTITSFADKAIADALFVMEKEKGEPFPKR